MIYLLFSWGFCLAFTMIYTSGRPVKRWGKVDSFLLAINFAYLVALGVISF